MAVARLRSSRTALLPIAFFAACLVPLASGSPWVLVVLVVPAVLALRILRSGVDLDEQGVTVRALVGSRTVPWGEVAGLRVGARARLWLVTTTGTELALPALRARDLPVLNQASGGRIPAP